MNLDFQNLTPQNIVENAIMACQHLEVFLQEENAALRNHDLRQLEQNLKNKQRLAAQVERLLFAVKEARDAIQADPHAKTQLKNLQAAFDGYQTEAKHNALLLQSAHQVTTDVLEAMHAAVRRKQAETEATLYSKDGHVSQTGSALKVISKDV